MPVALRVVCTTHVAEPDPTCWPRPKEGGASWLAGSARLKALQREPRKADSKA